MTRQQQVGYALVLVSVLTGITWAISQFIQPILPPNMNNSVILLFAALLAVLGGLAAGIIKSLWKFLRRKAKIVGDPYNC